MKKLLFLLCLIPLLGYGQLENIKPVTTIDTLSESLSHTDTTVVITYRIKYTHTYYKDYIQKRISELREDSIRVAQERAWMLDDALRETKAINTEKLRLIRFLNK